MRNWNPADCAGRSWPIRTYPFVIDTGAERTVISRELANQLGLSPGQPVSLTSMVDRSLVQTVIVPELAIESIGQRHTVHAPALAGRDLGAMGMLGIDTSQNHKVLIDFDNGIMTVDRQRRPANETPQARRNRHFGSQQIRPVDRDQARLMAHAHPGGARYRHADKHRQQSIASADRQRSRKH